VRLPEPENATPGVPGGPCTSPASAALAPRPVTTAAQTAATYHLPITSPPYSHEVAVDTITIRSGKRLRQLVESQVSRRGLTRRVDRRLVMPRRERHRLERHPLAPAIRATAVESALDAELGRDAEVPAAAASGDEVRTWLSRGRDGSVRRESARGTDFGKGRGHPGEAVNGGEGVRENRDRVTGRAASGHPLDEHGLSRTNTGRGHCQGSSRCIRPGAHVEAAGNDEG